MIIGVTRRAIRWPVLGFVCVHSFVREVFWWLSFDLPRGNPKHPRRRDGINSPSLPPADFVSGAMVVPVMCSAQRHRELVADLASHRARLSEPEVMGVGGASPTDQTRLGCNEL